jgi:hypothetical protein
LTRGAVLNAAREAGRDVFAITDRLAELELVGIEYLARPRTCDFDGVDIVGGTTTQFFANSFSVLGVGFELYDTWRRFEARGGVLSGVGWSM